MVKELDLLKTTVEELKVLNEEYELKVEGPADANGDVQVSGLCGWFDVNFRVRGDAMAPLPYHPSVPPAFHTFGTQQRMAFSMGSKAEEGRILLLP